MTKAEWTIMGALIVCLILGAIGACSQEASDSITHYSGMRSIIVDDSTGCMYLRDSNGSATSPLLNSHGQPVCRDTPNQ